MSFTVWSKRKKGMEFPSNLLGIFLSASTILSVAHGEAIVPMLCVFGDSIADVGNNNNRVTLLKANFPPYGRDFVTHKPTGRFCNGKLAIDFTAEYLGFTSYPPAYSSSDAKGENLLTGVNFASAGSGYYDTTAQLYGAITLSQQQANYKEYQDRVVRMVGNERASGIFSGGIHLLSAGSSDFLQNYYINPLLNRLFSPDQFSTLLLRSYSTFVKTLYGLGARRIGVTTLPPMGCLPAAITMFGSAGSSQCVWRMNEDAISFNNMLNTTSQDLLKVLPGLKLVVFDIYHPLLGLATKPTDNGFFESRRGCCGTGTFETSLLCNTGSVGTCSNATQYVFWDVVHPTEEANQVLAQSLLEQGINLIS